MKRRGGKAARRRQRGRAHRAQPGAPVTGETPVIGAAPAPAPAAHEPSPVAAAGPPRWEGGVLDLLRAIRSGEVSAANLAAEDRRACVERLTAEGYSVAEIAAALGVADRTVLRDRQRIRRANALSRDPMLADEMAGRLLQEADTSIARLRRIAREKEAPASARVEAERACWTVARELIGALQRLGHLPMAVVPIRADVTHRLGEEEAPEVDELLAEAARLEAIMLGSGGATGAEPARGNDPGRVGCRPTGADRASADRAGADRAGAAGARATPALVEAGGPGAGGSGSGGPGSGGIPGVRQIKDELTRLAACARLARIEAQAAKEGQHHDEDDGDGDS